MEVKAGAPLLARSQRDAGQAAKTGNVLKERIDLHGVFDHVRMQILQQAAGAQRIGEGETLMKVDHEIAVLADSFTDGAAISLNLADAFARVERVAAAHAGGVEAEEPIARLQTGGGLVAEVVAAPSEGRRVAF